MIQLHTKKKTAHRRGTGNKQRRTALTEEVQLRSRNQENNNVNNDIKMFSNNSSSLYSQLQGSEVEADLLRAETDQFWKNIW